MNWSGDETCDKAEQWRFEEEQGNKAAKVFASLFGLFLFWNFLLSREHTCAHDRCKHPALAVLDRAVARVGPHLQDVPAAGPRAGVHPLFEVRGPVPLQHAPVVFAVDLDEKEETKVRTLQAPVGVTCSSSPHVTFNRCVY